MEEDETEEDREGLGLDVAPERPGRGQETCGGEREPEPETHGARAGQDLQVGAVAVVEERLARILRDGGIHDTRDRRGRDVELGPQVHVEALVPEAQERLLLRELDRVPGRPRGGAT